ncbi:MAG: TRAP transporter small permease subunit [Thermodesulfobacteriota bacterium]|nr:TRAP transporter small permease subunit [Thermodesulfobacteriota bacterium]
MTQPFAKLLKTARFIDRISIWSGKTAAWLILPLVFGLTYEVISRYAFKAPTIWAYDLAYMLYGSLFMLGAAFTLYKKGHIRTDIFYDKWSSKRQGWIDAILYLFFFFPGMIFFMVAGLDEAALSWSLLEKSEAGAWRPPVYPFKTVIPLTALLLLVQGVSEFLKSVYAAVKGEWP